MYSLLMCGTDGYWDDGIATWELGRYLEYTNEGIKAELKEMSDPVIAKLKTLPTLFAYERHAEGQAKVGWITDIQRRRSEVRLEFTFDPDIPPISGEQMKAMLADLDIDSKMEWNRTHWAVKEIDLLAVLQKFKLADPAKFIDPASFRFSRQTLIKACNLLRKAGHADFDALLLDIGLENIGAGRDKGGLTARATVLGTYVVANSEERTTEGETLAYAVVRRAAESDPTYTEESEPSDPLRTEFWANFKRDGFIFENGKVVPQFSGEGMALAVTRPYGLSPSPVIERTAVPASKPPTRLSAAKKPRVFIVHGRDVAPKQEVARFLERAGLEPVILHERPNGGRTLIAKFQEESADIVFAIVLMTPDDVGGLAGGAQQPRARQNVIFELGFFIGKLGAAKVCALVDGPIEKPSDFDAVVYVAYNSAGAWKPELARELKHAGIPFDMQALL